VRRRRERVLDGQLVANWVDVFGPVICAERQPTHWPERIAVDSVGFKVASSTPRGADELTLTPHEPGGVPSKVARRRHPGSLSSSRTPTR
jgi:hypothetical protein